MRPSIERLMTFDTATRPRADELERFTKTTARRRLVWLLHATIRVEDTVGAIGDLKGHYCAVVSINVAATFVLVGPAKAQALRQAGDPIPPHLQRARGWKRGRMAPRCVSAVFAGISCFTSTYIYKP